MPHPDRSMFAATRWTLVLQAARSDSTQARAMLEDLCQAYWPPLYAYVRRRGYSPHDAEDLTQGFFARILKLKSLAAVVPEKGKFRAFLLASINHFIADEWDRASAQKRATQQTISLDAEQAEHRYLGELSDHQTPEHAFERNWVMTLLENVVLRLHREYAALGQEKLFLEIRFAVTGDKNAGPYAEMASRLGLSQETLRVAVHRLRQRYRRTLRQEIAQTVADESEVEEELKSLRRILSA